RVAAAADDEVAGERAGGVGFRGAEQRRNDAVVAAEPVERERPGVEFAVRRGAQQPVGVVLEQHPTGVERRDLHAPERRAEARRRDVFFELHAQLLDGRGGRRQRGRGCVSRAAQRQRRGEAGGEDKGTEGGGRRRGSGHGNGGDVGGWAGRV